MAQQEVPVEQREGAGARPGALFETFHGVFRALATTRPFSMRATPPPSTWNFWPGSVSAASARNAKAMTGIGEWYAP